MKKRLLSMLLALCLVLGLLPAMVWAAPEEFTEGTPSCNISVAGDGKIWEHGQEGTDGELPEGVSFDEASSTLTLNGADLTYISAWNWGSETLTIQVTGENTVSGDPGMNAIDLNACHDVVITGTGTLTVETTGRNEEGEHGTPLYAFDSTVPLDSGEELLYAEGQLVLDGGVTVKLINRETDTDKNTVSMNVIENLTVKNGTTLECESLTSAYVMGGLTVESGASFQSTALVISGFYDDQREIVGEVNRTFTVGGTVTLTGAASTQEDFLWTTLELDSGITMVLQDGGALTVDTPKNCVGEGIYLGVGGEGETAPDLKPARAQIEGGVLTVNMDSTDNPWNGYSAIFVSAGNEVTFSGNAQGNIVFTGAREGKVTAIDLSGAWDESGVYDDGAILNVKDNAELTVDFSGLTETTGEDVITGIEMTFGSATNVSGGKVNVIGMGGPAFIFHGIGVFGSELNISGGEVNVTASEAGSAEDVIGVTLGGFTDGEHRLNVTGGKLNIGLKAGMNGKEAGLEAWEGSSVDLSGGEVTIDLGGQPQNEDWYDIVGVSLYGRGTTAKWTGTLKVTSGPERSSGIVVSDFADLTIAEPANITVDAANSFLSRGIDVGSFAGVTVTGGTVDLETMGCGISVANNATFTVSGGKISINKEQPRPTLEYLSTVGIEIDFGNMRVLGGELDIQAVMPMIGFSRTQTPSPLTLGNGIAAVYAEGTMFGDKDYSGFAVEESYYLEEYDQWRTSYVRGDGSVDYNTEFGVVIKAQSAKGEQYSGLLELVNAGRIIAGQSYSARMIATLPKGTDELTVTGTNGTIVVGSVTVNGEEVKDVNYTDVNEQCKSFTLTINSGDVVRFQVVPGSGSNTYTATVAGETETLTFNAEAYTMEVPTSTNKAEVTVSGTAAPDTTVEVYVDGTKAGEAKANKAGSWSATVTLPGEGEHTVQAKVGNGESEEKTVTYTPDNPVALSLTVSNMIHGNTSVDPDVETSFTIDYVDPSKSVGTRYYTYWPELPTFTFKVKFDKPEKVAAARVVVTDWLGKTQTVDLCYNADDGSWTGVHDFCDGINITPNQFRVEWSLVGESGEEQTPDYQVAGEESHGLSERPETQLPSGELNEDGTYKVHEESGEDNFDSVLVTVEGTELTLDLAEAAETDMIKAYDFEGTDVIETNVKFGNGSLTLTGTPGELYTIEGQKGWFDDYTEYGTVVVMFTGGGSNRRVIQYINKVHRVEKEFDGNVEGYEEGDILIYNDLIIRVLADGKYTEEEIPLNQLYCVLDISGLQGARVKWKESQEAAEASFRESSLYAAMKTAAVREAEKDLGTTDTAHKTISVGEAEFDFQLDGEVDEKTNTVIATVTADITFTVSVKLPKDNMVEEDVHIKLTLKNTIGVDYRIKLDSTKVLGSQETSVPEPDTFAAYVITNTTTEISLHVDIPAEGEEDDDERFFSEELLEKDLEDLLNEDREGEKRIELPSLSVMIPAVPLLEFYIEPSIVTDKSIEGEFTLDSTLTLGSSAGVYVLEKKDDNGNHKVTSFYKNESPTITGSVEYHAQFDWSAKLRLEAGLRYAKSLSLAVFAQAGPELNIEGHAKFDFGTGKKPDFESEGLLQLTFALEAGVNARISLFGFVELVNKDLTPLRKAYILFRAGSNEMPTRFVVVEKEPSVVWSGSYVSQFVSMEIIFQSFFPWNRPSNNQRMAYLDELSFELVDKSKPVTIDEKTGLITIDDPSKPFDFDVKVTFHSKNYTIYKIVPLRYTPSTITIIKTTEAPGSRVATFTVADLETEEFTTVRTTAAGKAVVEAQPGHQYAVVESGIPAGYHPDKNRIVVTATQEGVTVNFYNWKNDEPMEPGTLESYPYSTVNTTVTDNGDPSGFVYEGLESNRLSGVTVTLYTSDTETGDGSIWDAAPFDQQNPLTTDALGQYLWMVPSGYWRVEYAKEEYDTCYSEWMTVPPVRTGINRNMTSTKPAEASLTFNKELQQYVLKFTRPVQVADVMNLSAQYMNWEGPLYSYSSDLKAVDADWSDTGDPEVASTLCATTFLLSVPGFAGDTFEIGGSVKTYMGTGSPVELEGKVMNTLAAPEKYRVIVVNGSGSGAYAPGDTVRVTPESRPGYTFTGWDVESDDSINIVGNSFTMPACDVRLTALYEAVRVPSGPSTTPESKPEITVTGNGTVKMEPEAPAPGDTVTLTVTPAAGCHLSALTVSFGGKTQVISGKDGSYTFTMPSEPVTIKAEFIPCPTLTFSDLNADSWYHLFTDEVITKDLMHGYEDGTFRPESNTTRAELVMVLWNLEKTPQVDFLIPFSDVKEGAWYTEAIRWAASEGFIDGYEDGTFRPDAPISREEMAKIIYRYEGGALPEDGTVTLPFTDENMISPWARDAMAWCTMKEIILGKDQGRLDPAGLTRRNELAAVLTRLPEKEDK